MSVKTPFFLFACLLSTLAPSLLLGQDFTEKNGVAYQGYRIHIRDVVILKRKGNYIKISCVVYNTGREDVQLGNADKLKDKLVVNFDESFLQGSDARFAPSIEEHIVKKKLFIPASGKKDLRKLNVKVPKSHTEENIVFTTERHHPADLRPNDLCGDLVLDTLFETKRASKKYAFITYRLRNAGKGAVSLIGKKDDPFDNISFDAYFAGTPTLGRGARNAGHYFIDDKALVENKGILFPGEVYTGHLKVDTSQKTRYTSVLILFVDGVQQLVECDETNNKKHILLK
jgi:hypothetical protein